MEAVRKRQPKDPETEPQKASVKKLNSNRLKSAGARFQAPDGIIGGPLENDEDNKPYLALWRAVVAQGVRDLASMDEVMRMDAVQWLGSRGFEESCGLACIDPGWLLAKVKKIVFLKEPYRKKKIVDLARQLNVQAIVLSWQRDEEEKAWIESRKR